MKYIILYLLLSQTAYAKMFKVAVLDSGYTTQKSFQSVKLCDSGHADTTSNSTIITDSAPQESTDVKHGTNIAYIIDSSVPKQYRDNYCIVVIKVSGVSGSEKTTELGFAHAVKIGADLINYSGGGANYSKGEADAIKSALDKNIIVVAAAGNERTVLEKHPCTRNARSFMCLEAQVKKIKYGSYFPAMSDDRVISVGSVSRFNNISGFSNSGAGVDMYELGEDVLGGGISLSGTSQAAAVASGNILKFLIEKQEKTQHGESNEDTRISSGRDN